MKKIALPIRLFSFVLSSSKTKLNFSLAAGLLLLLPSIMKGQQVIGSFPEMEGGFENATVASNTTTVIPAGTQLTSWTGAHGSGGSTPEIYTTNVRTGTKSLQWLTSASARLLFSNSAASTAITNNTSYVIQFYWWKAHSSSIRTFDVSKSLLSSAMIPMLFILLIFNL